MSRSQSRCRYIGWGFVNCSNPDYCPDAVNPVGVREAGAVKLCMYVGSAVVKFRSRTR